MQPLRSTDVNHTDKIPIAAEVFHARRECSRTFEYRCLRGSLLCLRTRQYRDRWKCVEFHSCHAMRDAELTRLRIERTHLLQWRFSIHDSTWQMAQFRPQAQHRLGWKLMDIQTGIQL